MRISANRRSATGGVLAGKDLATTFSFLRPNDLVWNYYVNNYLKGEPPPAFDLLYWNADSTNLPGPMYCWYLRHMYLQNELTIPDRLVCAGEPIDLRRIDVPTFMFGAREDHIVLWRAAYRRREAARQATCDSCSGRAAISPARSTRRRRTGAATGPAPRPDATPDDWLDGATEHPGSWWSDWSEWLAPHQGSLLASAETTRIEVVSRRSKRRPAAT